MTITSLSTPTLGQVGTLYTVGVAAAASNVDGVVPIDSIVVSDANERKVAYAGTFSQSLTLGLAEGTEVVQVVAYSHDLEAGPIRTASNSRNIARTPVPVPPTASQVSMTFLEADSSSTDLASATTGRSDRTYALLAVPPQLQVSLSGSFVKVRGFDGDVNGDLGFKYVVSDSVGADTADVVVTISPMVDFSFSLREARTDSAITSPAQLTIEGRTYSAVNGLFVGQVAPGARSIGLVVNAETFQSDRVLGPDGTLIGVNWPGNDTIRPTLSTDFNSPGRIVRLAKAGSPYGSLAEMLRIYNCVWTWGGGIHQLPIFDTVTIGFYAGPPDTLWGYTRPPTAQELDTLRIAALDVRAHFEYAEYIIRIDTLYSLPQWPVDLVPGIQVIGIGVTNANGTLAGASGQWAVSHARVANGFGRGTARDELYQFHAGQFNEDTLDGNTFFGKNSHGPTGDLTPGDLDIINVVNRLFARDAEKKRIHNGRAGYRLEP